MEPREGREEPGHRHRHRHRPGAGPGGEGPRQEGASVDLRDRITKRAYEIYLERGGEDGHALEDWLRAESEVAGIHRH